VWPFVIARRIATRPLEVDVFPLEAECLPAAASRRNQESEQGREAMLVLIGDGQQDLDLRPTPRLDGGDLGVLATCHAGDQPTDSIRGVANDQIVSHSKVEHAAHDR
jgi:hypothetical protein